MTPTEIATSIEKLRDQQAEAHRAIIAARRASNEFALLDAIHDLATVTTGLIDLCVELNDRLPMSSAEFHGLTLGEK